MINKQYFNSSKRYMMSMDVYAGEDGYLYHDPDCTVRVTVDEIPEVIKFGRYYDSSSEKTFTFAYARPSEDDPDTTFTLFVSGYSTSFLVGDGSVEPDEPSEPQMDM